MRTVKPLCSIGERFTMPWGMFDAFQPVRPRAASSPGRRSAIALNDLLFRARA
ncbi:hypothetical protein ACU4HD_47010 [Cupriavidus basilensis]